MCKRNAISYHKRIVIFITQNLLVSLIASPNCGIEKQLASPQLLKQTPICMYIHITFGRPNSCLHHNWKESSIEKHFFRHLVVLPKKGGIATTTATHIKVARNNKAEPCKSPTKIESCYPN